MKKIRLWLVILILSCLAACSPGQKHDLETAAGITASCRDIGAYRTVRLMSGKDYRLWDNFIEHVSRGEEDWLRVIPEIRGGTDAGTAESIGIALAYALPENPKGVLNLANSTSLKGACSIPFIEPEEEFLEEYLNRARVALDAVSEEYYQEDKKVCLMRMQDILATLGD